MKIQGIEYRAASSLGAAPHGRLEGYAAVFNEPTQIHDFIEVIRPGAFADSLRDRDILCLADHNLTRVLGRTRSKTLELIEDNKGLFFSLVVADTMEGRDLYTMAKRGDLGGMSIGFNVSGADGEIWNGKTREIRSVILHEVSIIHAWPAYCSTYIEARARCPKLDLCKKYLQTVCI